MGFFIGKRLRIGGITVGYYWRPTLGRARQAGGSVVAPDVGLATKLAIFIVLVALFLAIGHC